MQFSISHGFKAMNLIYKGGGFDSSILFPYMDGRRRTNTTALTVSSSSPPLFFALSYDGENSRYISPAKYEVDGESYTVHYLRDNNIVFYVFSKDIKRSSSKYGIEVFDDSGDIIFSSSVKPLRVIGGKSVVFDRHNPSNPNAVRRVKLFDPVAGKKVALSFSTGVYEYDPFNVPEREGNYLKGVAVRFLGDGNIEYIYRNFVYYYNKDHFDSKSFWYFFGASVGQPSYILAIDVTNL
ncbi:MAG: hypothetical protein ACRCZ3_10695 [Providencia rustigianii]|uniref:hypothetical protein n=1 Tax=Providencia rustigianii TaxID=158850 RepID=UPI003F40A9B5